MCKINMCKGVGKSIRTAKYYDTEDIYEISFEYSDLSCDGVAYDNEEEKNN